MLPVLMHHLVRRKILRKDLLKDILSFPVGQPWFCLPYVSVENVHNGPGKTHSNLHKLHVHQVCPRVVCHGITATGHIAWIHIALKRLTASS